MTFIDVVGSGYGTVKREVQKSPAGHARFAYWRRIALLAVLFGGAYGTLFVQALNGAIDGSRTAFLVVGPVLVALGVTGYRTAPRGIADDESDWIIAAIAGAVGFTGITLVINRFPTLAGFWRLELVGPLVWVACAGMVIFGVRQMVRMWQVWLYATFCATTVPYLLVTASLGGSDTAAVAVAVVAGSFAVYLAGRPARRPRRIAATAISLIVGLGAAILLTGPLGLFASVIIAAGILPVLAAVGLHHYSAHAGAAYSSASVDFDSLAPRPLAVLAVLAVALFTTHLGLPREPTPPPTTSDWAQRAGLSAVRDFSFASRFVGPDSTLVRYTVPAAANMPAAAVDVLSSPNLAALQDFSDAVWYPSPVPVNMVPLNTGLTDAMPLKIRAMHTNPDAATDAATQNWYALTWLWNANEVYQQVTVIVNQTVTEPDLPADPIPLTAMSTIIEPMLWVARQQPEAVGTVDKKVITRAADIVRTLVSAAEPVRGSVVESISG